ncbi:MAG: histidine phosphatase family protein [Acidimicrobiales bacterium]|nr:histidine phosphatase family protein [Acidimicrobiales bacterium]
MDLYIIRHGRPERQVVAEGDAADPPLSEIGHQQAKRIAGYLEHEGIHHVVSSTMTRAHQTAIPTAELLGTEIELLADIVESDNRSTVYVPAEEMSPDDPDTAHFFEGNIHDHVFSEGIDVFTERVTRGFQHIIDTNKSRKVAVFCHGMVTSIFLRSILQFPDPLSLSVDYCGLTRVRAASNGIRTVRSINETHHVRDLIEW